MMIWETKNLGNSKSGKFKILETPNLGITKANDERECLILENVQATNTIKHLTHMIKLNSNDKNRFYENARASLKHKKYAFTNGLDIDDTAND